MKKRCYVYYFGGVMMSSLHLIPIRRILNKIYGEDNVSVLSSSLSKDLPLPRKKKTALDIKNKLQKGDQIKLICHSLGAVEAMRIMKAVKPQIISQHYEQLSIDLISPAGLFSNVKGTVEFFRRFLKNSGLREKFRPTIRRGIESFAIYPLKGMEKYTKEITCLFPDWEPAKVQGKREQMNELLHLDIHILKKITDIDDIINNAIILQDKKLLEKAIVTRGRMLFLYINRFQNNSAYLNEIEIGKKKRLRLSHFTEAGKIIVRLLTGQTKEILHDLLRKDIRIRFVYLSRDPIVVKQDIVKFFGKDWNQLIHSGLVIPVGDLGHSSHIVLPDVLRLL